VCHRVQLGAHPGVYSKTYSDGDWGAYSECSWQRFESLLGNISHTGSECAIESNWDCIVKQAGSVQLSAIRSVLQSIDGNVQHAMKCIWLHAFKLYAA